LTCDRCSEGIAYWALFETGLTLVDDAIAGPRTTCDVFVTAVARALMRLVLPRGDTRRRAGGTATGPTVPSVEHVLTDEFGVASAQPDGEAINTVEYAKLAACCVGA
jgi:hypothetical protein